MVFSNLQLNIVMCVAALLINLFRPYISANLKANTRVLFSSGQNNNVNELKRDIDVVKFVFIFSVR